MTETRWHVPLAQIMADLARQPPETRFVVPLRHGSMSVEVYARSAQTARARTGRTNSIS